MLMKSRGDLHQLLVKENVILRGSREDLVKGRGQNIPLVTETGSGFVKERIITQLKPARLRADYPTSTEQATHTGEG